MATIESICKFKKLESQEATGHRYLYSVQVQVPKVVQVFLKVHIYLYKCEDQVLERETGEQKEEFRTALIQLIDNPNMLGRSWAKLT